MDNSVRARGIRPAAVAGAFYPEEPSRLSRMLDSLLETASPPAAPLPKAIIAPHAGYQYSGPIAASAFVSLRGRTEVRRIILLGPSHHHSFAGIALSRAEAFATPLGPVPLDQPVVRQVSFLPAARFFDEAHALEHSLEVELPFLQQTLGHFTLVPLLVGNVADEDLRHVIDLLWGGPETVFVISSDLSHYYDYETAQRLDGCTARAIEQLCPGEIGVEHACGRIPIRGLLCAARERDLRATTLDLRNSGDTAGRRDRVVGYGAIALG